VLCQGALTDLLNINACPAIILRPAGRDILKCRDNFGPTPDARDPEARPRRLDAQDRLSTSSALFREHARIPGSESKDFAPCLICEVDVLDNSSRRYRPFGRSSANSFCRSHTRCHRCERRRGARPIAVEPQVFDWLVHLVQNRDRVVREEDLLASSVAVGSSRIRPLPAAPTSRASML
jgi:hypothetical protein